MAQNRSTLIGFPRSQLQIQLVGIGLGLSLASSALGQLGGFGTTNGQNGGLSQMGGIGQLGGLGQTGGQTGGFGQTGGLGQTGGQAGGLGQTGGINQLGSPNMANAFGSGGILGSNTSSAFGGLANTALLSRSLNGSAGAMGGMGGMGGMGMGGMGGGRGGMQGGRGGFNSMNQNPNSSKPQVRATVKLGFDYKAPSSTASSQLVNSRLGRIPSTLLKGISVEMSGRTAVIRGNVATLAEAKTVERFLSLEPGIDGVENQLTIASGEKFTPKAASKKSSATTSDAQTSDESSVDSRVRAALPEIVPAPADQR